MPARPLRRCLVAALALALLAAAIGAAMDRAPGVAALLALLQVHVSALAAALGLAAFAAGWRGPALAAGVAAMLGAAGAAEPLLRPAERPAAPGPTLAIAFATANLNLGNPDLDALREALAGLGAEVLVTQETPRALLDAPGALAEIFPHRRRSDLNGGDGGPAIWSRFPLRHSGPGNAEGPHPSHLIVTLDLPEGGRLQVMTLHFAWPAFDGQARQVADFARFRTHLSPPLVVAGDFNAPPWSRAIRQVERVAGVQAPGGWRPTWVGGAADVPLRLPRWAGLPIDHLAASPGIGIREIGRTSLPGSDHLALTAELRVPLNP